MKKLFFAALVATVAVGGALSTTAQTYRNANDSQRWDCSGGNTLCNTIPETTVYTVTGGSAVTVSNISPSELYQN